MSTVTARLLPYIRRKLARDDQVGSVDHARGAAGDVPDFGNPPAIYGKVAVIPTGAADNVPLRINRS